jgi:hypothetical protein
MGFLNFKRSPFREGEGTTDELASKKFFKLKSLAEHKKNSLTPWQKEKFFTFLIVLYHIWLKIFQTPQIKISFSPFIFSDFSCFILFQSSLCYSFVW